MVNIRFFILRLHCFGLLSLNYVDTFISQPDDKLLADDDAMHVAIAWSTLVVKHCAQEQYLYASYALHCVMHDFHTR